MDSLEQFTNCLDGLLRDPCGNVMDLNPMDYEHQTYRGPCRDVHAPVKKASRFRFDQGKLLEVPFDSGSDVDYVF